ncbi:peptide chain release factor N(5)-glutamine methyltransferase [Cyclobacterium marinum]|uniref:peptide chain release factor N(5)-glutamine methyltransferase n=1 Tax=Cyclobacterium marinum TaxID=104 RepID=UPI0011EFFA19|nr:peptide chain release factor N(5)-glutamine methyltransferase [Cyclobacterium marinum]MBI0400875.1 peptide chain release factor N(5)-glutamine methyltransferase [Cyclobacterium marinum]
MNLREVYKAYVSQLISLYPDTEARSLVMWLFEAYLSVDRKDVLNNQPILQIPEDLQNAMNKLMAGEPIQYILEKAPFYGREFRVGPGVLIPRNETEELVQLILQNHKGKMKVLDLGTGSGCIAITLALEWAEAEVSGLDISEQALAVANENAAKYAAKLNFIKADVLQKDLNLEKFDLMVSNPPYVLEKERTLMQANVLKHEPELALFVPDEDPLRFYKAICLHAKESLHPNGFLFFEINEAFGPEVVSMMNSEGFGEVRLVQDINGKDRIVYGQVQQTES